MINLLISALIAYVLVMAIMIPLIYFTTRMVIKYKTSTRINKTNLDKDTAKIFFDQLEMMIQYETIYAVDVKCGETLGSSAGATVELSNDDLNELYENIQTIVITNMSSKMRDYLYDNFGELWIYDYIRIYTLSMLINYTNLSIESLSIAKK